VGGEKEGKGRSVGGGERATGEGCVGRSPGGGVDDNSE